MVYAVLLLAVLATDGAPDFVPSSARIDESGRFSNAPAPVWRSALAQTAAVTATLATGVLAVLSAWSIPALCFARTSAGNALCSAAGFVWAGATQVGLAILTVPETYRLADDASGRGSIAQARSNQWRLSRWAALAGAIFVTSYVVGAMLERNNYGSGQVPMLIGGAGSLASLVAFDVLQLLGASHGYHESRRAVGTP